MAEMMRRVLLWLLASGGILMMTVKGCCGYNTSSGLHSDVGSGSDMTDIPLYIPTTSTPLPMMSHMSTPTSEHKTSSFSVTPPGSSTLFVTPSPTPTSTATETPSITKPYENSTLTDTIPTPSTPLFTTSHVPTTLSSPSILPTLQPSSLQSHATTTIIDRSSVTSAVDTSITQPTSLVLTISSSTSLSTAPSHTPSPPGVPSVPPDVSKPGSPSASPSVAPSTTAIAPSETPSSSPTEDRDILVLWLIIGLAVVAVVLILFLCIMTSICLWHRSHVRRSYDLKKASNLTYGRSYMEDPLPDLSSSEDESPWKVQARLKQRFNNVLDSLNRNVNVMDNLNSIGKAIEPGIGSITDDEDDVETCKM